MADAKISALPTDTAPDAADLVPFVDVTAGTTEAVTVANLAASSAFAALYTSVEVATYSAGWPARPTADLVIWVATDVAATTPGAATGDDIVILAQDTDLTAIAALTSAANKVPYATGAGTWALADFTAAGRALVDDADAAAQVATLGAVPQAQAVNAQTGTTYTLVAADAGKLVSLSNASAITLTLPQDSDATIAVGTYVDLYQLGAGQVTVAAGTGSTLRTSGLTAKARAQYSRLGVQKVSTNTWSLFGDLAAS